MPNCEYMLNEKKYVQKPLVLGQVEQLADVIDGLAFPSEITPKILMELLKDKIYTAVAVVITEEGKSPKDKDLAALAEEIKWGMPADDLLQVVEDFFDCNPISSLLGKIGGMAEKLSEKMKAVTAGSPNSSASVPVST